MTETWQKVKIKYKLDAEYEVSDFGNVRRLKVYKNGETAYKPVAQFTRGTEGLLYVNVKVGGRLMQFRVDILVASAFVDNPRHVRYVRHKDGNRLNNVPDNLVWCSFGELKDYEV